jgi:hypothetical protein
VTARRWTLHVDRVDECDCVVTDDIPNCQKNHVEVMPVAEIPPCGDCGKRHGFCERNYAATNERDDLARRLAESYSAFSRLKAAHNDALDRLTESERSERFSVVHLHQSGKDRWLHTSNKPTHGCDLSTYIETITVRRLAARGREGGEAVTHEEKAQKVAEAWLRDCSECRNDAERIMGASSDSPISDCLVLQRGIAAAIADARDDALEEGLRIAAGIVSSALEFSKLAAAIRAAKEGKP